MAALAIEPGADQNGMAPNTPQSGGGSSAGSAPQGQLAAQNAQAAQMKMAAARDAVTQTAKQLQIIGQQFPEMAASVATALKALKDGLTMVAGNPERTPERQAPPNVV